MPNKGYSIRRKDLVQEFRDGLRAIKGRSFAQQIDQTRRPGALQRKPFLRGKGDVWWLQLRPSQPGSRQTVSLSPPLDAVQNEGFESETSESEIAHGRGRYFLAWLVESTLKMKEDVGFFTWLTTYIGYMVLIAIGHMRDMFGRVTGRSRYVSELSTSSGGDVSGYGPRKDVADRVLALSAILPDLIFPRYRGSSSVDGILANIPRFHGEVASSIGHGAGAI